MELRGELKTRLRKQMLFLLPFPLIGISLEMGLFQLASSTSSTTRTFALADLFFLPFENTICGLMTIFCGYATVKILKSLFKSKEFQESVFFFWSNDRWHVFGANCGHYVHYPFDSLHRTYHLHDLDVFDGEELRRVRG